MRIGIEEIGVRCGSRADRGPWMPIEAHVSGNLAVHRSVRHWFDGNFLALEPGYNVTHVPSGLAITPRHIVEFGDACAFMDALNELYDWSTPEITLNWVTAALYQQVLEVMSRINPEVYTLVQLREPSIENDERYEADDKASEFEGMSHNEIKAALDARIESTLAEFNRNLPVYNPE